MQSIFRKRNPDVEALFQSAGHPEKVLCVPFDYAKKTHTAMACDGNGRKLHGEIHVENNRHGLDFLLGIVAGLCRKHHIRREHAFFGGEDCGAYAFNFIDALVSRGFLVVGINAREAKEERQNSAASTDLIDTVGVAGMMIKRKGRTIGVASEQVHGLKRLRRQRRSMLKAHAASAHRIHRVVEELFPGFLSYAQSGVTPFSRCSLWLMEERFSPGEFLARKRPALLRKLQAFGVKEAEEAASKLKVLAEKALPPAAAMVPSLQRSLTEEVGLYRLLGESIHGLDTDIAKQIARTPAAMLTTIPGIGLRWAPGLYAELGDPMRRRNVHSMASLGGLTPRIKQTGGPEKPARIGHRTKACSSFLKHVLMSGAVSISQYGCVEMREAYRSDKAQGRDARTRLAQKLLRIALHTLDHQTFFLPPSLHHNGTHELVRAYYQRTWPKVLVKWRDAGAIREATAEGSPLRQWREMAQELYDIELDLRSPQTGRK